ncbi:MAG: class I SAM-dependent methyltransferase [Firmicutes bacterium]|nr:class I SAM-dependent methyltransferase [Bacillota bacterium]
MDALKNIIPEMIEEWEEMQDSYYPDRQQLYGFMTSIIPRLTGVEKVLDICTGVGSLSKKILEGLPGANVTGIDFDDIMLEMAKENLKEFEDYFTPVKKNLWEPDWYSDLPGDFDVVVSSYAIHILPENRRQEIYADVCGLLRKGGFFICLDEVKSSLAEFDNICSDALSRFRQGAGNRELSADWSNYWNRVGKKLGSSNYSQELLKTTYPDGTDTMGTLYDQLTLLGQSGFSDVECFYRDLSIAIYGGMKAEEK